MLQWETAAAVAQRTGRLDAAGFYRAMRSSPVIAVAALLVVAIVRPRPCRSPLPILLLWLAAPYIAFLLSKPAPSSRPELTREDAAYLRSIAEKTWRYFETFTTDEDRALPPDNVQFEPELRVAHRTSPTNIAMAWLSTLAAHDLGLIETAGTDRADSTRR